MSGWSRNFQRSASIVGLFLNEYSLRLIERDLTGSAEMRVSGRNRGGARSLVSVIIAALCYEMTSYDDKPFLERGTATADCVVHSSNS